MEKKLKQDEVFICECHNSEHSIIVHQNMFDDSIYVDIHLAKLPFIKRLFYGIKYILGYTCKYGAFDEFIFNEKDSDRIIEIGNMLKKIK